MDQDYEIRVMTAQDCQRVVDWAAAEGWNPGLQDAEYFSRVDPRGFWGGWIDDEMTSSISVVNYDPGFAFLGFYIVAPDWRGQGYGLRLWQRALEHAGNRVVGLDGVVDQQDNYRASGFALAYRHIRYGGSPVRPQVVDVPGLELSRISTPDTQFMALDQKVFPAHRSEFWSGWLQASGHVSIQARRGGDTVGFGTLRPCQHGFKIGPLVADERVTAEAILVRLLAAVPPDAEVFLDVPEVNGEAVALAQGLGLEPVFETARMYRGDAPALDLQRVFGVTSFELG